MLCSQQLNRYVRHAKTIVVAHLTFYIIHEYRLVFKSFLKKTGGVREDITHPVLETSRDGTCSSAKKGRH